MTLYRKVAKITLRGSWRRNFRDHLAAVAGSTRTWYVGDALGSVRMTLDDVGAPLGVVSYALYCIIA